MVCKLILGPFWGHQNQKVISIIPFWSMISKIYCLCFGPTLNYLSKLRQAIFFLKLFLVVHYVSAVWYQNWYFFVKLKCIIFVLVLFIFIIWLNMFCWYELIIFSHTNWNPSLAMYWAQSHYYDVNKIKDC